VLVVDDEPAIRALVAKIVERAGHPVDVAADGLEAQEKINQHDYAVVVLDLMMPHVNGFEFIDILRERPGRRPSVIVITAAPELSVARQLDPQVVHSVIRKPFDINVLADLIAAAAESQQNPGERTGDNVIEFHR
jgi:CheY-like chemotaxis protein